MTTLKGMTWNHSRGYVPLVAAAQRYSERHLEVEITWEKRSLQAFADHPIEDLAKNYDFIIIDHPHIGLAAACPSLVALDELLPSEFLADQAGHQVGRSHDTYHYAGHQWALALDAATPVASWRPDLLPSADVPPTWEALLALAREGKVAVPAIPIDSLMAWYGFCVDQEDSLFSTTELLVTKEVGIRALEQYRELVMLCPPDCLDRNPIHVYEALVSDEHPAVYCPFAYGYSNYARLGYGARLLQFGNVVNGPSGKPLRTTLGGTGLAISQNCQAMETAADFAQWVMSPLCQSTLFLENGGQPGHRAAWENEAANTLCHGFFRETLATLDRAYLRPRYYGYMLFQDEACLEVYAYLKGEKTAEAALERMSEIYLESLKDNPAIERITNPAG